MQEIEELTKAIIVGVNTGNEEYFHINSLNLLIYVKQEALKLLIMLFKISLILITKVMLVVVN